MTAPVPSSTPTGLPEPELLTEADFSKCRQPVKKVSDGCDIPNWLESEAYSRLMTVMFRCNAAIRGKKRDLGKDQRHISETTRATMSMLDQLADWVDEIPLATGPQRFGNKAFRDWGKRLEEQSEILHKEWLPDSHSGILVELLYYFNNAFGNWIRIDYGSGHELSFLGYLTILRYTGLLTEQDEEDMVFSIFEKYLSVCRKLQKVYRLEPAGSKGVWGLEDHQFLNFLWGSSQLVGNAAFHPSHMLQPSHFQPEADEYLFFSSISHINVLKKGPFHEHSPILYNISQTVPNWAKVNSGLIKMYQAEVLEKYPVIQHFYFGELLPWRRRGSASGDPGGDGYLESSADHGSGEDGEGDIGQSKDTLPVTKAPWAGGSSQASTAAPWAATSTSQLPATGAPWATSTSTSLPSPSAYPTSTPQHGFRAPLPPSRMRHAPAASRIGGTLASTGSAAALSSPMGALSQPLTGAPSSRQSRP